MGHLLQTQLFQQTMCQNWDNYLSYYRVCCLKIRVRQIIRHLKQIYWIFAIPHKQQYHKQRTIGCSSKRTLHLQRYSKLKHGVNQQEEFAIHSHTQLFYTQQKKNYLDFCNLINHPSIQWLSNHHI
ncbi:hypothetical protein FGO68_gene6576 [Halteria grandinella]|uniref:Uncharacterized protein n=1 Tax=Halteria grandinella TaxID=5974 RepID=A0A8J8TAD4_HALGN|nr:hypothetical protein FGO68_gene6576 [Halteria grandinella]